MTKTIMCGLAAAAFGMLLSGPAAAQKMTRDQAIAECRMMFNRGDYNRRTNTGGGDVSERMRTCVRGKLAGKK